MSDGGLQITRPLGLSATEKAQIASDQDAIHSQWETFDNVELELHLHGVDVVEKPQSTIPRLTSQMLMNSENREFSEMYATFGEWYGFVANSHARCQAKIIEIANEMKDIEVYTRKRLLDTWKVDSQAALAVKVKPPKRPTVQEMSDEVRLDQRYRTLTLKKQEFDQHRILLDSRKEQLYRDLQIVSRQVEIRAQEMERHRIGGHMSSRGYVQPGQHYPAQPGSTE